MLKIAQVFLLLISFIIFTACGGGSSDSEGSASLTQERVYITTNCSGSSNITTYHILYSGDSIVNESSGQVSIYHGSDNNKYVCRDSGTSYIIRN
jgi:hypothetical protein